MLPSSKFCATIHGLKLPWKASGWVAGKSYDPEADEELMAEDRVEAVKRAERNKKSGIFSCETIQDKTYAYIVSSSLFMWMQGYALKKLVCDVRTVPCSLSFHLYFQPSSVQRVTQQSLAIFPVFFL